VTGFLLQTWGELRKLFTRRRSYMGFAAVLILQTVILVMIKRPRGQAFIENFIRKNGEGVDYYFSAPTIGFLILHGSIILLGGIYISLVAGDIVAKDSEDGNLRMLLARPVSRLRVLGAKYLACLVYNALFVFFMGVASLVLGFCVEGFGGGFLALAPDRGVVTFFPESQALPRYFLCVALVTVSMMTVTTIAFLFSCLPIKPAAATILALSVIIIDMIISENPLTGDVVLLTDHLAVWVRAGLLHIPWAEIWRSYLILFGVNVTLFTAGWVVFQSRDFKS